MQWQYVITYVVVAPQNIVIKFNSGKTYIIFLNHKKLTTYKEYFYKNLCVKLYILKKKNILECIHFYLWLTYKQLFYLDSKITAWLSTQKSSRMFRVSGDSKEELIATRNLKEKSTCTPKTCEFI